MTALREAIVQKRNTVPLARARKLRIGVLYPSGWGNLGDEAILQSTFAALRERWPDADLWAFTLHPARTAANHRVVADTLTGITRPMFLTPRVDEPFVVRVARGVERRTRRVPLLGRLSAVGAELTSAAVFETASLGRARKWIQRADLVLVAGGGQLDSAWGGTWGQPYALARWAWLAKQAKVPFAFLSVGFGKAGDSLSQRFMRYAIRHSAYCSVRDEGSLQLTATLGAQRHLNVVPDLAFALATKPPLAARRPGLDIGVSPMVFLKPGGWPDENAAEYDRFVGLWASLIERRAAKGDRIHLFVSDPGDMDAVRDVQKRLSAKLRAACLIAEAETADALLEFYRGLDVVVSSRLHGVLLAIVAGRPVLALAHERKVRAVMSDAGVSSFCAELSTSTMEITDAMIDDLVPQLDTCARRLRDYAASARAAVRSQNELIPGLLRRRHD